MKHKETIWIIIRWVLLVLAYGYLAYCLWTYDDYPLLVQQLFSASWVEYLCLVGCVALMPLNLLLESMKWRTLLSDIYPMSLGEAQRQVYYGFIGAFVTPYRAGDYPSRVLLMRDRSCWKEAISMGIYGSVVLTLVIVLVGWIPALLFLGGEVVAGMQWYLVLAGVVFLLICISPLWRRLMPQMQTLLSGHIVLVFLQSLGRYLVFSLQLYLMLRAVGVAIPLSQVGLAIPVYYLLVTLTPNMPVADAGIRGSWAVFVFSRYTEAIPQIILAAVGLWVVNTILPLFIGTFLRPLSESNEK